MFLIGRPSIQSKLILMLLVVSIASIAALSYMAYSTGQDALRASAFDQLTSLRASKKRQIEEQFQLIRNQVVSLGDDLMIVNFMKGLRPAFAQERNAKIPPEWDEKLTAFYRDQFLPQLAHNVDGVPLLAAYVPKTPEARYFQYHYLATNPFPDKKYLLLDPGDGSELSAIHRIYQPILSKFMLDFDYQNMYLIDNDSGDVVYTNIPSPALATNALTGPYAGTSLTALYQALAHTTDPEAVEIVDFSAYPPAYGRPVAMMGTPIFDGNTQIGILAVQLPTDEIDRVMTGNRGWERDGLGKTGQAYLVGPDHLMRSVSRVFVENKAAFLKKLADAGYSVEDRVRIDRTDTTILARPVRTAAVESALAGEEGTKIMPDGLGIPSLVSYAPVNIPGLHWVIAAELSNEEAFAPLNTLSRRILLTSVAIILGVTMLAGGLAYLFIRPAYQLIAGINRLQEGHTDVSVSVRTRDEFSDLAEAFNVLAKSIREKGVMSHDLEVQNEELLAHLMPPGAAARYRKGDIRSAESFPDLSVLYARFDGFTALMASLTAEQAMQVLNDLIAIVDGATDRFGVEKIKTAYSEYMVTCGLSIRRIDHANRILDFAQELQRIVRRFNTERGTSLGVRIGIDTGPVIAGLVGKSRASYNLWGETVEGAVRFAFAARPDSIMVSQAIRNLTEDLFRFDNATPLDTQSGGAVQAFTVRGSASVAVSS
jgi:class 3 adenylate cyclase